jgi:hypothetical protein
LFLNILEWIVASWLQGITPFPWYGRCYFLIFFVIYRVQFSLVGSLYIITYRGMRIHNLIYGNISLVKHF